MHKHERLLADGARFYRATWEGKLGGQTVRIEGCYISKNHATLLFNLQVNYGKELSTAAVTAEMPAERVEFEEELNFIIQWLSAKQFEDSRKITGFTLDNGRKLC